MIAIFQLKLKTSNIQFAYKGINCIVFQENSEIHGLSIEVEDIKDINIKKSNVSYFKKIVK